MTTSTPSSPLFLPPEIISSILTHLSSLFPSLSPSQTPKPPSLNATLLRLSQVSISWSQQSLHQLYSALYITWSPITASLLLKAIAERPSLTRRIRSLSASAQTLQDLMDQYVNQTPFPAKERLEYEWETEGLGEAVEESTKETWMRERKRMIAREVVVTGPDGFWVGNQDKLRDGDLAFWSFVSKLENLRTLDLKGFIHPLLVHPSKTIALEKVLSNLEAISLQPTHHRKSSILRDLCTRIDLGEGGGKLRRITTNEDNFIQLALLGSHALINLQHLYLIQSISLPTPTLLKILKTAKAPLESLSIDFSPTTIGTVSSDSLDWTTITHLLLTIPTLRSLTLFFPPPPPPSINTPSPASLPPELFLNALATSSLTHFALSFFPPTNFIPYFPPTIQSLKFWTQIQQKLSEVEAGVEIIERMKERCGGLERVEIEIWRGGGGLEEELGAGEG
ncbi:hypothetical protein P7C70_g8987, partial [Phenoliferia sp. Uapishka_3]